MHNRTEAVPRIAFSGVVLLYHAAVTNTLSRVPARFARGKFACSLYILEILHGVDKEEGPFRRKPVSQGVSGAVIN